MAVDDARVDSAASDRDGQSRWALVRQVRSHPGDQSGLWVMLGLWLGAVVLCMVAVGDGNPFSVPSIVVVVFELATLGVMLMLWSSLNTGVILGGHAVLASLSLIGTLPAVGVASVALMFGAAEAGQNWWALVADHDVEGATIINPPDRRWAPLEVIAIAIGAAILVGILGLFESRVATVAAIGVFIGLVVGAVLLRRND